MIPTIIEQKFKSRKFIIALLLILCTSVLAFYKVMTGTEVTIIFGIVGSGYGFANIADKKLASNNSTTIVEE